MTTESSPTVLGKITLESLPVMTALALPVTGSYDRMSTALDKVMAHAQSRRIAHGAPFGVYHSNPEQVPEEALSWEVCVPVEPGTKVEAPFVIRELPATKAAILTMSGPYDGVGPGFGALSAWVKRNGYQMAGPPQEHWLSDPDAVPPEKRQTRIVFPVKR